MNGKNMVSLSKNQLRFSTFLLFLLLFSFVSCTAPDLSDVSDNEHNEFFLSADSISGSDRILSLPVVWKCSANDNPQFADPEYDDSAWPSRSTLSQVHEKERSKEQVSTVHWYRLSFDIDEKLYGQQFYLICSRFGIVRMYLDGELIFSSIESQQGKSKNFYSGFYSEEIAGHFKNKSRHLLAVRIENPYQGHKLSAKGIKGFFLRISTNKDTVVDNLKSGFFRLSYYLFVSGLALAIALVYLFLYIYYPYNKVNLFYAIFTLTISIILLSLARLLFQAGYAQLMLIATVVKICVIVATMYGTIIIRNLFPPDERRTPRGPKTIRVIFGIGILLFIFSPFVSRDFFIVFAAFVFSHWLLSVITAIRRGYEGTWLLGAGFLVFIITVGISLLSVFRPVFTRVGPNDEFLIGIVAMLLGMTLYLAKRFARMNFDLKSKIDENKKLFEKTLQQERAMKDQEISEAIMKKELEEAREKQKMMDELARTNDELRQTQAQLVQSEKMASLGSLVAGVAHEINTPIGAISSMHDTSTKAFNKLKNELDDLLDKDSRQDKMLKKAENIIDDANRVIASGSERVAEIVRRLRSFARLDEAELKNVNVHDGIEDTLLLIHHEIKNRVEIIRSYGEVGNIWCYPRQLNQVFLNLFMNASQAIEGKGVIAISTKKQNEHLIIEIADNGTGIKKEHLEKIFDPGFTTKGVGVGTGLGLSICYRIIENHKGDIWASNREGGGALFTISLPLHLNELINKNKK